MVPVALSAKHICDPKISTISAPYGPNEIGVQERILGRDWNTGQMMPVREEPLSSYSRCH
jgi:hypothetical protein